MTPMIDDDDRNILDDIERVGWSLICISEDSEGPGFVYSVGMMQTLGHPEIIMFGLDIDLMANLINGMGKMILEGRRFDEVALYEDLLEGYACKCIPVAEKHHTEFLGYAMWHRRHVGQLGTLKAVQCLWPDRQGKFPDEAECDPRIRECQPVLDQ